jgi:elongation factor G
MILPAPESIRNIGIISHIDAGKTTVSERILFYTGEIHRMGEVHDGSATMDWMEQEQERGITITATANCCRWGELWINLIDTPGHIDFTIEVERSLRVLDGALAIFSAVEGVQPQSESVWRQADRYRVPRICLINKMDRIGADYQAVLEQMAERLRARPVLLQLPIGNEGEFTGVLDLLAERALTFAAEDFGRTLQAEPIPVERLEEVRAARERIIEAAADFDDSVLADFLEGHPVAAERLVAALRKGTLACQLQPVMLGSALRNKGMQPVLDAIGAFLPSPLEIPPVPATPLDTSQESRTLLCDAGAPFCALAFKVVADEGRKLTYLRIYSGRLAVGDTVYNASRGGKEKVARLFRMHAHRRERLEMAQAGDIVAAAGLREPLTGDTLCDVERPLRLEGLVVPEPVVTLAVEPRGVDDREKLLPSLEKLQWEDPTFRVREDAETGQTVLIGMGELHLEILLNRLSREFGVQVLSGRPQVVYRETLQKKVERREIFQREIDGRLQTGEILLRLNPLPCGSGLQLFLPPEESLAGELRLVVEESLAQGCAAGAVAGYPLTDLEIIVLELPVVPGQTTSLGVRAATQRGLALAAREGAPILLEPLMVLEVITPSEYAGKVLGGLQQKRGRIEGLQSRVGAEEIKAIVPLSEMFGYMTELRSATRGHGTFTMEFSHFDRALPETQRRFGLA